MRTTTPMPGTRDFGKLDLVQFADGTRARCHLLHYAGGCLAGQPTVYTHRNGQTVWVKPGASVSWVEVPENG